LDNRMLKEGKNMAEFEPKIIGFVCKWCTGSAADLAGTSRTTYPPNITLVRLMCTGSIDVSYVVKALLEGADGVLIGGCHPGDCHYISGNFKARRRLTGLKTIMKSLGIEEERVEVHWIGADEGKKFAATVAAMNEKLKKMGPSPLAKESI
jgi:F420-non-reducing hydrogenase iron-sulfur subunit